MNLPPYNLTLIVAAFAIVGVGAVVFLLGNDSASGRYITFATPLLVVLVGAITAHQNTQNHAENQAVLDVAKNKLEDLDQQVRAIATTTNGNGTAAEPTAPAAEPTAAPHDG